MALEKCPHMIARCPHYQTGCLDPESKHCHHIKQARAAIITALSALQNLDVEWLSEEMHKYREEARAFFENDALMKEQKTR